MSQIYLKTLSGQVHRKNIDKYLIKWNGKSLSKMQFGVKQFLKKYWIGHLVYEEFPVFGTRLRVDFLNLTKNIAIEVNGPQHGEFNKFFHNNSRENYFKGIERDIQKHKWLKLNDFELIELEEKDIKVLSKKYILDTFGINI